MLSPILHELAEEKSGALKVGKINVDEQMELAMRFQVSSIPMLVVFKDGKALHAPHMVCVLPDGNHDAGDLQAEKQRIIKDNRKESFSWLN